VVSALDAVDGVPVQGPAVSPVAGDSLRVDLHVSLPCRIGIRGRFIMPFSGRACKLREWIFGNTIFLRILNIPMPVYLDFASTAGK
jgi:hypothetical protein